MQRVESPLATLSWVFGGDSGDPERSSEALRGSSGIDSDNGCWFNTNLSRGEPERAKEEHGNQESQCKGRYQNDLSSH